MAIAVEALIPPRHQMMNALEEELLGLIMEPFCHSLLHFFIRSIVVAPEVFQWVPKCLSESHYRMGISLNHLNRYQNEGDDFLCKIIAGDESICPLYQPESKRESMQWKHTGSPKPKKISSTTSAAKVMMTVSFDEQGPLLVEFLPKGETINANKYCDILCRLRIAIKNKRRDNLTKSIVLLHDNARPHVAKQIQDLLASFQWEVLDHPAYGPDLSPCDFHVFWATQETPPGEPLWIGSKL